MMKKWLTMLVMVSMLVTLGGVQPVQAAEDDFNAYFEQAAIFPVDFNSRVYVKGDMLFLNGPVEMKEGVLYVSSVFLDDLLADHYKLMGTGAEGSGEIRFIPSEPGQYAWSYEEGDSVAFAAYIGETQCVVWDETKTLAHAPYRMMLDNGTPYAMLPLRDVAGALGLYCAYQEGLIVLAETAPNTPLEQNSDILQTVKAQLTQPFVGYNTHFLTETASGIMIYDGEENVPITGYDHFAVYEAQDSKGRRTELEVTTEPTTAVVKNDIITQKQQLIAQLPNIKVTGEELDGEYYLFYIDSQVERVPQGYLIEVLTSGGSTRSNRRHMFYAADDGRLLQLSENTVDSYIYDEDGLYFCSQYSNAQISGQMGWLYQFNWSSAEPKHIGISSYRQLASIGDGEILVAVAPVDKPEQVSLYRLELASGRQQLLTEEILGDMIVQNDQRVYFQIVDGEIYYISAADGKLYALPLGGGQSRLVAEQPPVKDIAFVGGMLYGLGQDGHLYQQSLKGGKAVDVSGCKVKDYAAGETRVYYIASGYQAGLYLVENNQTQKLLAQPLEGLALDQYGTLAVQPKDACAEYYLCREGKLQTVTLR